MKFQGVVGRPALRAEDRGVLAGDIVDGLHLLPVKAVGAVLPGEGVVPVKLVQQAVEFLRLLGGFGVCEGGRHLIEAFRDRVCRRDGEGVQTDIAPAHVQPDLMLTGTQGRFRHQLRGVLLKREMHFTQLHAVKENIVEPVFHRPLSDDGQIVSSVPRHMDMKGHAVRFLCVEQHRFPAGGILVLHDLSASQPLRLLRLVDVGVLRRGGPGVGSAERHSCQHAKKRGQEPLVNLPVQSASPLL